MGSLSKVKDRLALTTVYIGGKLKFRKARDLPKSYRGLMTKLELKPGPLPPRGWDEAKKRT